MIEGEEEDLQPEDEQEQDEDDDETSNFDDDVDGDADEDSSNSQMKFRPQPCKKGHHHHHHHHNHKHNYMSGGKSSTLPKPLKGILKNKASAAPHILFDQEDQHNFLLLQQQQQQQHQSQDGSTVALLDPMTFGPEYNTHHSSTGSFQQPLPIINQQQLLPLNLMNSFGQQKQQQQPNVMCHTLPRHLDVVPFDTLPPCDDCLRHARYQASTTNTGRTTLVVLHFT